MRTKLFVDVVDARSISVESICACVAEKKSESFVFVVVVVVCVMILGCSINCSLPPDNNTRTPNFSHTFVVPSAPP